MKLRDTKNTWFINTIILYNTNKEYVISLSNYYDETLVLRRNWNHRLSVSAFIRWLENEIEIKGFEKSQEVINKIKQQPFF